MLRIRQRRAPATVRGAALVLLGLALALGDAPRADDPPKEVPKAPEPLEAELVGIRNAIINASAKLRNGVVGISAESEGLPSTPARDCCAANVRRIETRIVTAARLLDAFDRCYDTEGNQDMLLSCRVAKSDLLAFANALQQFVRAPTRDKTQAGLDGMTRTYNLLRDTSVKLEPCELLESPVDDPGLPESDVSDPGG